MNPEMKRIADADGPMPRQSTEDTASIDLGDILREARERQGLSLEDIAGRTKLPRRLLESLERNNLAALPPGMYRRAEVLAYANAVGLDPHLALASLARAQGPSSLSIGAVAVATLPAPTQGTRRRYQPALMVILIVLFALVGTWWMVRQFEGDRAVAVPSLESSPRPAPALPLSAGHDNTHIAGGGSESNKTGPRNDTAVGTATAAPTLPAEASPTPGVTAYPTLLIVTTPPGARITVDGVGWGQSPLTIRVLPAGARRVRATLDGYAAQERVVDVSEDAPRTTVRMTLKPGR